MAAELSRTKILTRPLAIKCLRTCQVKRRLALLGVLSVTLTMATPSAAADDIDALRQQLKEQKQELDRLNHRIDEMSGNKANATTASAPALAADARDDVGDMNSEAVKTGDFPGSFRIPGTGNVSLAIGGFIKSVAIYDTHAEAMGSDFLASTLAGDGRGAFSLDSTLTRVYLDGRAPVEHGKVRGYVEYDLNATNNGSLGYKLRHAYGTWTTESGALTAGHTWSSMMDLKILPEGLTEPTVSGVIFARQSILSWTQAFGTGYTYHVAIEDPSSDVSAAAPTRGITSLPDVVLGLSYARSGVGHVALSGIVRRLEVTTSTTNSSATASGATITGLLKVMEKDKIALSTVYGNGLGRYFLGIDSSAGSRLDPAQSEIQLRTNTGGMVSYQHYWSNTLRSTAMFGRARAEPLAGQLGTDFESSSYASINLMWSVLPYITAGIEYASGSRKNVDGTQADNQRIAMGIQIF